MPVCFEFLAASREEDGLARARVFTLAHGICRSSQVLP
jgi:hypothetical protein